MDDKKAAKLLLGLLQDYTNPVRLRCGNFRRLYWDRNEWIVEDDRSGQVCVYRGEFLFVALRILRE